jgi:hypothetical protein
MGLPYELFGLCDWLPVPAVYSFFKLEIPELPEVTLIIIPNSARGES